MIPSSEDIRNRAEDMDDGYVKMPRSDFETTIQYLEFLERIEAVVSDPWGRRAEGGE